MADTDLDAIIRKLAKQQHKILSAAVKKQRDRYAALAARTKDADARKRLKQTAKDVLEIGTTTVKRLQMSADNAAYSYARSIRQAAEAASKKPEPAPKKAAMPAGTPAKKGKKAAKKASAKPSA